MALIDTIQTQIADAMKSRDDIRLNTLRSIKVALDKHLKDLRKDVDEAAEHKILETLAKQRTESRDIFLKAHRIDLVTKEQAELDIIESFLPSLASGTDIDAAVAEALAETGATTIKQMGLVLSKVRATLAGKRVDGAVLAAKIKITLTQ